MINLEIMEEGFPFFFVRVTTQIFSSVILLNILGAGPFLRYIY